MSSVTKFQQLTPPINESVNIIPDSAQLAIQSQDSLAIALDSLRKDSLKKSWSLIDKIPFRKNEIKQKTSSSSTKPAYFDPLPKNPSYTTWPVLVLTFALLLLAFIKAFGASRFKQIYKSLFSYYAAHEVTREERVFFHRVNLGLFIIFIINVSLLIYFFTLERNVEIHAGLLYPVILIAVLVIYFLKILFNGFLAWVFSQEAMAPYYSYSVLLYNYLLGVLLIPVMALVFFSNFENQFIFNFIVFPLITIVLIFRFIRFFTVGIYNNVSVSYIFLYICTLEILPLVVLGKFFI